MADSLWEKVNHILDESDFNELPYEERRRIGKYRKEQQILDIVQMIKKDKEYTTEAWRKKQISWLENCVSSYYSDYKQMEDKDE